MMRTQMQLCEETYRELKQVAAMQNRSMADCIREAIGSFLERSRSRTGDLAEIAGSFRPLPIDELKPHDRFWVESLDRDAG